MEAGHADTLEPDLARRSLPMVNGPRSRENVCALVIKEQSGMVTGRVDAVSYD